MGAKDWRRYTLAFFSSHPLEGPTYLMVKFTEEAPTSVDRRQPMYRGVVCESVTTEGRQLDGKGCQGQTSCQDGYHTIG